MFALLTCLDTTQFYWEHLFEISHIYRLLQSKILCHHCCWCSFATDFIFFSYLLKRRSYIWNIGHNNIKSSKLRPTWSWVIRILHCHIIIRLTLRILNQIGKISGEKYYCQHQSLYINLVLFRPFHFSIVITKHLSTLKINNLIKKSTMNCCSNDELYLDTDERLALSLECCQGYRSSFWYQTYSLQCFCNQGHKCLLEMW